MDEEKTNHKFLNKEKYKKIFDVWVDRYVTVGFFKILVPWRKPTENIPV